MAIILEPKTTCFVHVCWDKIIITKDPQTFHIPRFLGPAETGGGQNNGSIQ